MVGLNGFVLYGGEMTKRELIEALAPYDDDQYVGVRLFRDQPIEAVQLCIQGVKGFLPWHQINVDRSLRAELIGIVCHEENRELDEHLRGK